MKPISEVKLLDCMDGMRQYPEKYQDKEFDWLVADIPYGLDVAKMAFTQEVKTAVKQKNGSRLRIQKEKYDLKNWDKKPPGQDYFDEVRRVSKNQIIFGVEYVNWDGLGSGRIRWNKLVNKGVSFKPYEMAYCSSIDDIIEIDLLWAGMNQAKSIKEPTVMQGNKALNEKRIHPTQKPVLLYQMLYSKFCKPGDKILDTHLGSGSSRIAAYKMGFDFYGFEIDQDYFNASEKRFKEAIAMPLFDAQPIAQQAIMHL